MHVCDSLVKSYNHNHNPPPLGAPSLLLSPEYIYNSFFFLISQSKIPGNRCMCVSEFRYILIYLFIFNYYKRKTDSWFGGGFALSITMQVVFADHITLKHFNHSSLHYTWAVTPWSDKENSLNQRPRWSKGLLLFFIMLTIPQLLDLSKAKPIINMLNNACCGLILLKLIFWFFFRP